MPNLTAPTTPARQNVFVCHSEQSEELKLSPGVRHAVKRRFAVRCFSIVHLPSSAAGCAPAGEAEAGSAGAQPTKE